MFEVAQQILTMAFCGVTLAALLYLAVGFILVILGGPPGMAIASTLSASPNTPWGPRGNSHNVNLLLMLAKERCHQ